MSGKVPTYDRIYNYLKGLLSNRERHELEKDMMHDSFNEEAFDGISRLSHEELEADMQLMMDRLDERIQPKKQKIPVFYYRIAAGFIFLIGLGSALYFLVPRNNTTELLTQETGKEIINVAPETSIPAVPDEKKELKSETQQPDKKSQLKSNGTEPRRQSLDGVSEDDRISDEMAVTMPESAKKSADEPAPAGSSAEKQYITGRVLGVNRQALAGVSVMDKGTRSVTKTDNQGNFMLPVNSSSSIIALQYSGYKSMEVSPNEISGKEISMNEDRVPVNEMLVMGYGKQRSGAGESQVRAKAAAPSNDFRYYKPVPAGGSFKSFETWVENQIHVERFTELLPGNYKIIIDLVVNTDGTLGQISVKDGVPPEVAEEYKRVVALSKHWHPARANETPVESQIELIFTLIVQ